MISVKVTKIDNTAKVIADLRNKQVAFVAAGGQIIRTEMVTRVPVDTGNLRNSVLTEAGIVDGKPTSDTGPTAEYAEYVERGTSRMKAQPYAEPGFQSAKPQIDKLAERALKE